MSDTHITPDGWVWYRQAGSRFELGFTQAMLDRVLSECWCIIPTHSKVKEGQPLFAVETNDLLWSIPAPFSGKLVQINLDAQNAPERLKKDTVVMTIQPIVEVTRQQSGVDAPRPVRPAQRREPFPNPDEVEQTDPELAQALRQVLRDAERAPGGVWFNFPEQEARHQAAQFAEQVQRREEREILGRPVADGGEF